MKHAVYMEIKLNAASLHFAFEVTNVGVFTLWELIAMLNKICILSVKKIDSHLDVTF